MTPTLEQLRATILDESLPLATRQTAADTFVAMRRDAVPEEQRRALVNAVLDDRRQPRLVRLAAAELAPAFASVKKISNADTRTNYICVLT